MELIQLKGRYKVIIRDGKKEICRTFDNLVTAGLYGKLFRFLDEATTAPSVDELNITHLAIGTGTTAPTLADVKLQTEYFRKAVSFKSFSSTKFTCETSIAAAEGNPTGDYIKEVGIFCDGTASADSGTLISRALVDIYKTSSLSIIIVWELTY